MVAQRYQRCDKRAADFSMGLQPLRYLNLRSRMSATRPLSAVESVLKDVLAELHTKSACEEVGLTRESFTAILCEVGQKYATPASSELEIRTFFLNLRVDELALARACAEGNNSAWEIFLTRYREKLYLSALRIAREDSAARELADTLYADLYGTTTRDGQRVSKLASYTGRGSLEGWLRTVLAQEYVNRYRRREDGFRRSQRRRRSEGRGRSH